MKDPKNERFDDLVSLHLDGHLNDDQEAEFLTYLEDAEYQRAFLEFVHTDRAIAGLSANLVGDKTLAALVRQDIEKTIAEQATQAASIPTVPSLLPGVGSAGLQKPEPPMPRPRPSWFAFGTSGCHLSEVLAGRQFWRVFVALGVLLAVVVVLVTWKRGAHEREVTTADLQEIARLEDIAGDVRVVTAKGQTTSIKSSAAITSGDTIRTRGAQSTVFVVYGDGTRLTLVGDTDVTCTDQGHKSVVVHQGTLAASVKPQPRGKPMLLATPAAQVEVLGTQFLVEALRDQTDLSVTQGSVRLIRISDGKAVDVPSGKRLLATDRAELAIEDIPQPPDTWEIDFEEGLPDEFGSGRFVKDGPPGSKGAVAAVRSDHGQWGVLYEIKSPSRWYSGLFAVHEDSHFHFTYKMDRPQWVNVFIIARGPGPEGAHSGNYLFNELFVPRPGETWPPQAGRWRTASIPFSAFRRAGSGKGRPLPADEIPFLVLFSSDEDRGLVVDRMWVTRGGPGIVEVKDIE
jgi:hypothetical protein